jgi:hypothetical protein
MLRLLLVALPLVVALPAAFDAQEVNALQFEVQSPLQFEVRSPPKSRPLRPAATRDQHDRPATAHSTPHAHHPPSAHITMDEPRHQNAGKTIHPTIYVVTNLFTAQGYQPTIHRCAPQPGRPPRMRRSFRSALPLRARGRCACCRRTRTRPCTRARCPLPRLPDSADSAPASARRHLRWPSARASERARRLACFADGLRVAPPVQAAAAACGRAHHRVTTAR